MANVTIQPVGGVPAGQVATFVFTGFQPNSQIAPAFETNPIPILNSANGVYINTDSAGNVTQDYLIVPGTPNGSYPFIIINGNGDTVYSGSLAVVPSQISASVQIQSFPNQVDVGKSFQVVAAVSNTGNIEAGFLAAISLSQNGVAAYSNTSPKSMKPGESATVTFNVPGNLPPGDYVLSVGVSSGDFVANAPTETITVKDSNAGTPILSIQNVNAPPSAESGAKATIVVTVQNVGTAAAPVRVAVGIAGNNPDTISDIAMVNPGASANLNLQYLIPSGNPPSVTLAFQAQYQMANGAWVNSGTFVTATITVTPASVDNWWQKLWPPDFSDIRVVAVYGVSAAAGGALLLSSMGKKSPLARLTP